jgi:hypothetical protein
MCALVASAGATGVRSWLQAHHGTWLTRERLRYATIAIFSVALLLATVGMSGSSKSQQPGHAAAPVQASHSR